MSKPLFFTEELFVQTIEVLQKQETKDRLNAKSVQSAMGEDSMVMPYDNHLLNNQLLLLLQSQFPPLNGWCDIEYFMHELDYGEKFTKGTCTDVVEGKSEEIDLSSASKLYQYLCRKNKT